MSINNETLGQTAEKVICDLNKLDGSHLSHRSDETYEKILTPILSKAINELPKIISHAGLHKGRRGGASKSSIDFYLKENKTLSIKTNKNSNSKVCPSEVGQSSWEVLEKYFAEILDENNINKLDVFTFKQLVFKSIDRLIPIYLNHLMYCDYLLWIFQKNEVFFYKIFQKNDLSNFNWNLQNFSFTKNLNNWNESCTVKYNGISIGEFQIHSNRSPKKKFRFNMRNLCKTFNL